MVVPVRPLGTGHLADDELPRRDLLADVLEEPLACFVLSFVSRLGHDSFIVRERSFLKRLPPGRALRRDQAASVQTP